MVLQTEIRANIVAGVDKKSFNDGVNFAKDTGKKIDQDLRQKLRLDLAEFQVKLDEARKRLRQAKKEGDKDAQIKARLEINDLSRNVTEARRSLRNLGNTGDKEVSRLGRLFGGLGRQIKSAFAGLGSFFAAAFVVRGIGRFISSIDQARATIVKLTGATGDSLDGLEKSFTRVLRSSTGSVDEVASAIGELNTRLGLTGTALEVTTSRFIDFARVNNIDVNSAVRGVSRVLADSGAGFENTSQVLDKLTVASQISGISFNDLSNTLVENGVQLRALGFSLDESIALLSKFEKEGVSTKKIFSGLQQALGRLAEAGVNDTAQAFDLLTGKIEATTTTGDALRDAIEILGTRAGPDFALAVKEGRFAIEDYTQALQDSQGALSRTAEESETLQDSFRRLSNGVSVIFIPAIQTVVKILAQATDGIVRFANSLGFLLSAGRPEQAFENLGKEAGKVSGAIREQEQNLRKLTDRYGENSRQVRQATQNLDNLKKRHKELLKEQTDISKAMNISTIAQDSLTQATDEGGGSYEKLGASASKSKEEINEQTTALENSKKEMEEISEQRLKKLQDRGQTAFDAITDAVKDSEKAVQGLKSELEGVDAELANIQNDIASRVLDLEKELKDINIDISSGDATQEDFNQRRRLEEELALARANVNAEVLQKIREEEQKSETQKLLDRQAQLEIRKQELQAEIEFERQLQENLTLAKKQLEEQITQTHKIELKKQEDDTRAYADSVIAMYREIQAAARAAASAGGMGGGGSVPGRAIGGPVGAGSPYIVGERGPELFVPQQSGNIVPNNEINNNITVNANVSNDIDLDLLGNTLAQKIALSRKGIF